MRPHRRQPTKLPRPWDSPGKNTGVGCHFLFQCMKVKSESEVTQLCPTLSDPMDCSLPGSSVHGFSRQEYWSGVPLPSPTLLWALIISVQNISMANTPTSLPLGGLSTTLSSSQRHVKHEMTTSFPFENSLALHLCLQDRVQVLKHAHLPPL